MSGGFMCPKCGGVVFNESVHKCPLPDESSSATASERSEGEDGETGAQAGGLQIDALLAPVRAHVMAVFRRVDEAEQALADSQSRLISLERERDQFHKLMVGFEKAAEAGVDRVRALEEALDCYSVHRSDCKAKHFDVCTCGLDDLFALLAARRQQDTVSDEAHDAP